MRDLLMSHVHTEDAKLLSFSDISELKSFLNENYLNRQRPLFTFLSGSIAEGLSTPKSDYDVYAVYDECEEAEVLLTDFERPIEVTSIKLSKLISIFEFVHTGKDLANISPYELLLCHRVHSGISLTGQSAFQALKNLLDAQTFRERLSELCFLYAERSLKVCAGNLLVDDHDSALLNAQHAVRQTFNRLLAVFGATSLLEKWQLAYAEKYLGRQHPAYKEFIQLMSVVPYENEVKSNVYIERAFRFQQVVGDYVQFEDKWGDFDWDARFMRKSAKTSSMILCKSALSRVIEMEGKFYMVVSSTPLLEIPTTAANLWAMIDNQSSIIKLQKKAEEVLNLNLESFYEYLEAFSSVDVLAVNNFKFEHFKVFP